MAEKFTRTVTSTIVSVKDANGVHDEILAGDFSATKAAKALRKGHPELKDFTVESVRADQKLYELSLDDFMKVATEVVPKDEKAKA